MADHLEAVQTDGYGCVGPCRIGLTPLHAFIGPNDSGKSTLLRMLADLLAVPSWIQVVDGQEPATEDAIRLRAWLDHAKAALAP